jgi:hypothetical protein
MADIYEESYSDYYGGEDPAALDDVYSDTYGDTYGAPTTSVVHTVEPVTFDTSATTELLALIEGEEELVSGGVTGALVADPVVVPGGTDQDGGSVTFGASGGLTTGDPTVESGGRDIVVEPIRFGATGALYAPAGRSRAQQGRVLLTTPTAAVSDALNAARIHVWRAVDILNRDESLWAETVPFTDGNVNVELDRDERRTLALTLDNSDRRFSPDEREFWYDKIIRVRRGVVVDEVRFEFDLGHFMIDQIAPANKANSAISVTGRDYSKAMITSRIEAALTFKKGTRVSDLIRALAGNCDIRRVAVPWTAETLLKDTTFDADTSRWAIAKDIATAFNYELYFSASGELVMRPQRDPVTSPTVLTLGPSAGNVVDLTPSTNDGELFNHVVVVSTVGDTTLPVWAAAENNEPSSPSRISRIGRRTKKIESAVATTREQCLELAKTYLSVAALEQYDVAFSSLNYPWLEVGDIVRVDNPEALPGDPSRFLLTSLTVPLKVGAMSGNCKRVTVVGRDYSLSESGEESPDLVWGDELAA